MIACSDRRPMLPVVHWMTRSGAPSSRQTRTCSIRVEVAVGQDSATSQDSTSAQRWRCARPPCPRPPGRSPAARRSGRAARGRARGCLGARRPRGSRPRSLRIPSTSKLSGSTADHRRALEPGRRPSRRVPRSPRGTARGSRPSPSQGHRLGRGRGWATRPQALQASLSRSRRRPSPTMRPVRRWRRGPGRRPPPGSGSPDASTGAVPSSVGLRVPSTGASRTRQHQPAGRARRRVAGRARPSSSGPRPHLRQSGGQPRSSTLDDRVGVEEHGQRPRRRRARPSGRVVGHASLRRRPAARAGRGSGSRPATSCPCCSELSRHAGAHLPGPEDRHRRHGATVTAQLWTANVERQHRGRAGARGSPARRGSASSR